MRPAISFTVSSEDEGRLESFLEDRNAPQNHVWRARIVFLSAQAVRTLGIMGQTGKSKTCVRRWQERFKLAGLEGMLRDKARPSRIKPLGLESRERVVALTLNEPPGQRPFGPAP